MNCTTHHHACHCREVKFSKVIEALDIVDEICKQRIDTTHQEDRKQQPSEYWAAIDGASDLAIAIRATIRKHLEGLVF